MQRTKSSVFESLRDVVPGAVFVDVYAAAGAIGIEALSRGAAFAHFVENDPDALVCLRANLDMCRIGPNRCRVHAMDVSDFLVASRLDTIAPDVVYVDPPYGGRDASLVLEFFDTIGYDLRVLVLEHPWSSPIDAISTLQRTRVKSFGQTCVSFFEPRPGDDK